MTDRYGKYWRAPKKRLALMGVLGILVAILLIAAACGEDATPTPRPATAVPAPTAVPSGPAPTAVPAPTAIPGQVVTATPVPSGPAPTAVPVPTATAAPTTGLRDRSQWTLDNPATLAEIEAELENYRGKSFVFVSWGGAFQAAQRRAHLIPFQEKFGIEIIEDSPVSSAKVRIMAQTGNITWDIASLGGEDPWQLGLTGDLEELDRKVVDVRSFFPSIKDQLWSGGGGETWTLVLAYSTESYPDEASQPKTWADVWDVASFPGRRAFSVYWSDNLYAALLSENPNLLNTEEGRASLSPLTDEQIDRAFGILEEFKPNITLFWSSGSDCPQLLISGEIDMCMAWNGRIFDAQQEGAPLKICWECGHFMGTESFVIPKGLKEQDPEKFELAQLFIAWTSFPEQNARIAQFISYGPVNKDSAPYLDDPAYDPVRDELPSSSTNIDYAILVDEKWQGEMADVIEERFQAFLQR
ncbi:MAG: extracellular solute-binding protein [Dehalococcoidia bacterium]